ncbi:hypothetical protein A2U01_0005658, partial [Trifolium medium]|nr:hypothetical protein [Trifolium medium]
SVLVVRSTFKAAAPPFYSNGVANRSSHDSARSSYFRRWSRRQSAAVTVALFCGGSILNLLVSSSWWWWWWRRVWWWFWMPLSILVRVLFLGVCLWLTSTSSVLTDFPQVVFCFFGAWLWLFRHYRPRGGASVVVWSVGCLRAQICLPRFTFYHCPISLLPYVAVF